ncbi:hypothetical protein GCM10022403_031820 [Streptomyces coacervatus]|uniref:Uncharacterized protein n=1 Tax=Streptomyces coacervatus TaxID=647381 RepID=A0ABP7HM50_9ACTN
MGGGRGDQYVDLDPAGLVEREPDALRLVAQMLREVLRHLYGASFGYASFMRASFFHPFSMTGETWITQIILARRFDPQPTVVIHRLLGGSVDNSTYMSVVFVKIGWGHSL